MSGPQKAENLNQHTISHTSYSSYSFSPSLLFPLSHSNRFEPHKHDTHQPLALSVIFPQLLLSGKWPSYLTCAISSFNPHRTIYPSALLATAQCKCEHGQSGRMRLTCETAWISVPTYLSCSSSVFHIQTLTVPRQLNWRPCDSGFVLLLLAGKSP